MIDWAPKTTEKAVVMTCDRAYLPFAAFLAWQIATKSGPRDFDIIIASEDDLPRPEFLKDYGIKTVKITLDGAFLDLPVKRLPRVSYLRLQVPQVLRDDYRRVLYLDCDMQFEGGDLARLFELDLSGAAIGAVRDVLHTIVPRFHAPEFKSLGLPAETYFNSGLLLIDTSTWLATDVVGRCLGLAAKRHDFIRFHDQSLINAALCGEIAELCPVWNWMLVDGHDPLVRHVPVRIQHFITDAKPYRRQGQHLDRRFREVYRDFFERFCPDWVSELPLRDPLHRPPNRRSDLARYIHHMKRQKAITAYLAPFKDEWTVLPPRTGRIAESNPT